MKKAHILRKNLKGEMPRRIIFFDTETKEKSIGYKSKELFLKLGWACYWDNQQGSEKWLEFKTPKEFWKFVFSNLPKGCKLYLVGHNVAFDFRIVKGFKFLKQNNYNQDKIIFKGVTNIYKFSKNKRSIVLLDNMNFFSVKLEELGKSIGLDKMDMEKDNLSAYCKRDVEILLKAWKMYLTFLRENDLGNFALTIASQALNAFRHKFMDTKIFIHNNINAIKAERESYHGGRVECFKLGKMPVRNYYLVDVISMYPSLMRLMEYPKKLVKIKENIPLEKLGDILKSFCAIAEVELKTLEPVFCYRQKNKVIYPTGKFIITLTTRELQYALIRNYILKVNKIYIYRKGNLFKSYVDFFYMKKKLYKESNNPSFSYMCKIFLNSLYGKFGQKIELFKAIGKSKEDGYFEVCNLDTKEWTTRRGINGVLEEKTGWVEGYESFVAISSHITADARMKLWNLIRQAGRANVYYCDTDSLIVNSAGYANLKNELGNEIGNLELQKQADNFRIYGLKDYELGDKKVLKGIRSNALQIDDKTFSQVKFEGLAGAIRNNRLNKVVITYIEKKLKRNYDKGIVDKSGEITPILI